MKLWREILRLCSGRHANLRCCRCCGVAYLLCTVLRWIRSHLAVWRWSLNTYLKRRYSMKRKNLPTLDGVVVYHLAVVETRNLRAMQNDRNDPQRPNTIIFGTVAQCPSVLLSCLFLKAIWKGRLLAGKYKRIEEEWKTQKKKKRKKEKHFSKMKFELNCHFWSLVISRFQSSKIKKTRLWYSNPVRQKCWLTIICPMELLLCFDWLKWTMHLAILLQPRRT